MMTLALPLALLLLPLPLLARLLPPRTVAGQAMILPDGIARAARQAAGPAQWRGVMLLAAIWTCLCLALAQPERIEMVPDRSASGRDIVIALDMSGSMITPDFALDGETVTRLAAVKRVAESFIRSRTGDRIGLVIFGDRAYAAAPLTHDLPAVARALEEAEIGLTGRSTAISEGLGLSLKRVMAEPSTSKVIVLLSDGRDTAERLDAAQVAALAAGHGVRIHTVALGPEDLETRPAARDAVDVATLRNIAEAAGGETFRVRSTADLEAMARALDRLEPNPSERPAVAMPRPMWIWPALLALVLTCLTGVVRET
ncbi:VWA domain-containing protein [Paracoccus caeni]|uniref:VWA domain-containing protein n=1 Tax=Paracoccus caeni TaxID=657651 RepID=A0A934W2W8_9RHOB|nr:VWA domain-containing protein [Paracoccus caeni]MBK4218189.1 VWA domain-containing protein [Paracoccus caeni]